MTTIPASQLVRVIPNVLSAGGSGLVMNGIMLTHNARVPTGQVLSFPNDGFSVAAFFGSSSDEATQAAIYFNGFNTSTQKPATIFFAQYNQAAVAANLRGGPVDQLSLQQLQGISGTLSIIVDGATRTAGSLNLAAASSFSAAAALIATALNTTPVSEATGTASIAAGTASVTGSIAGNVFYVTSVSSGVLVPGAILSGTGVTASTQIDSQLSGTTGGIGTYAVSIAQVTPSTAITAAYGTLTVTVAATGTFSVGQTLSGGSMTAGTNITALGTGQGLTGTYIVTPSQTFASGAVTASSTSLAVTYDSVSGAFVITSGVAGAPSTIAYATGTTADSLFLTQAKGAVLSQGAEAQTANGFMNALIQYTQNWATFWTLFDPDGGSGNVQKQAFAAWVNSTNKRYCYVAWDSDVTPTLSTNASASLGNILDATGSDGTACVWGPVDKASFICGSAASIDFGATNGRITFAFRGQDGLVADVTTATIASNLIANGYNFYGAYATANQQFLELQPGQVSGEFEWLDSYINQIWLNNALQLALMVLLQEVNSVPYNQPGYDLIAAACADPINAGVNFGAIRAGVTLSQAQIAEINSAAGAKVNNVVESQGWYLQVKDASPQVRQARTSPPINFFYTDGESVQQITLNSTLVQ